MVAPFIVALALLGGAAQEKPVPRLTPGEVLLRASSTDAAVRAEVVTALRNETPLVRATAARVLIAYSEGAAVAPLLQALATEADPVAAAEMMRAVLLLGDRASLPALEEAARRVGSRAVVVLTEWYSRYDVGRLEAWLASAAEKVSPAEALTISRVLQGTDQDAPATPVAKAWNVQLEQRGIRPLGKLGSGQKVTSELRVMTPWAPGLLDSVTTAAGCKIADQPTYGFAKLAFGPQGRLSSVTLGESGLSTGCRNALTALVLSEVAAFDRPLPPGTAQWVMVPFDRAFFNCTDQPDDEPLRAGVGDIAPPRKTKDQRPQYPAKAQIERRQGLLVAESVISARGCVRELRVVRSAGLDLDVAGILAISRWEFEPARQAGQPIAVRMTVTVNFELR